MKMMLTTLMLLLAGCSSVPDTLDTDQPLIPFTAVLGDKSDYVGEMARWQGLIAAVENQQDRSRIEVVYVELDRQGRPRNEQSPGRFVAYLEGFVDPLIYAKGRSFSVLGRIAPPEVGRVGEHEMSLPVIMARSHKLWERVKEVEVRYVDPYPLNHHFPHSRW